MPKVSGRGKHAKQPPQDGRPGHGASGQAGLPAAAGALLGATAVFLALAPLTLGFLIKEANTAWGCAATALGALATAVLWRRGAYRFKPQPLDWAVGAFVAVCLLSLITSADRYATLLTFSQVFGYGAVFLIARGTWTLGAGASGGRPAGSGGRASRDNTLLPAGLPLPAAILLVGLVGGAFMSASEGLKDYLVAALHQKNPTWRTFGTFFNPNAFAGYLYLAVFPTLACLVVFERPILRAAAATCLVVMLAALLLTASKGGLLAFLVGAVALGSWALRSVRFFRRVPPWAVAGVLLLAGVGAALAVPPARVRLLSAVAEAHSALFRWYTWKATAQMAVARPVLGWGSGTYGEVMPQFAIVGFTGMAHNDYLQILAETGVPGLAAWLAALVSFGVFLRRRLSQEDNPTRRMVAVALASGVLSFAVHGLVDYDFYVQATGVAAFLSIGLCVGLLSQPAVQRVEPRRDADQRGSKRAGASVRATWESRAVWSVGGLATLLLAFSLLVGSAQTLGRHAERLARQGEVAPAKSLLARACALMPLSGALRIRQSEFLLAYGEHFEDRASLREAENAARVAIRLQPYYAKNYRWLGDLLVRLGRLQEAASAYEESLRLNPHYLQPLVRLASVRLRLGETTQAERALRSVLQVEKSLYGRIRAVPDLVELDYARAHLYLGALALRQGNGPQVKEHAGEALRIAEESLTSTSNIALNETFGGAGPDQRILTKALSLALLSQAETALGDDEAAKRHREEALALAPESLSLLERFEKEWVLE